MDAIELSSIHTSERFSSPQTTILNVAPSKNSDPCSFSFDNLFNNSLSSTNINSQGLIFLDDGDLNKVSFNISIFSGSIFLSSYTLILLLFLNKSIITKPFFPKQLIIIHYKAHKEHEERTWRKNIE